MTEKRDMILTKPDAMGRHWVYVTGAEAHAHPKGGPGPMEYGIALWFSLIAAFETVVNLGYGQLGIVQLVFAALMVLCAVGLILRMPWSFVLAVLLAVREMFGFVQLIGGGAFEVPPALALYGVVNAILGVGIVFYLVEGDRPNLIYRHRYRSYRAEAQEREGEEP